MDNRVCHGETKGNWFTGERLQLCKDCARFVPRTPNVLYADILPDFDYETWRCNDYVAKPITLAWFDELL
jgi:hypothetical protein